METYGKLRWDGEIKDTEVYLYPDFLYGDVTAKNNIIDEWIEHLKKEKVKTAANKDRR